jgi:hypothetical protein
MDEITGEITDEITGEIDWKGIATMCQLSASYQGLVKEL